MTGPALVGQVGYWSGSHTCLFHRVPLTQNHTRVHGAVFFPLGLIESGAVIGDVVCYMTIPSAV